MHGRTQSQTLVPKLIRRGEVTDSLEKGPQTKQGAQARGDASAGAGARLTLGEVCEAVGVPPSTFRQIVAEFEDLLEDDQSDEGDVATLSEATVERLRAIVQWRNQGVPAEEIRARLQGAQVAAAASEPSTSEMLLLRQLEQLGRALQRSEEQRIEDRDRMLTAMMRTQQEIQQLRYALAAQSSRRDRKKKGLFRRLFG